MVARPAEAPLQETIPVEQLDFDKRNPRFPAEVAAGDEKLLLERFVRDERLLEIIESIADQGYFPGEPLLVVTSTHRNRFIVVEGNRRLAALKLLSRELEPPEGRISIQNAVDAAQNRPSHVPCLVFAREDQILRYLGFRHITGIKAWSALQKARYVKRLYEESYSSWTLSDGLRALARETGSKASYMGQMLSALGLYEMAEQENFYDLGLDSEDIDFSILSTALSYSHISDYVGLKSRTDSDLDGVKADHLRNIFEWLFLAKANKKSVVGESRNLKKLAAVVASKAATKELLKGATLDDAFEYSKGPAIALSEALMHAERRLGTAYQWIPKVPDINEGHLERANLIYRTAGAVRIGIEQGLSGDSERPVLKKRIRK
jgi:hypothetical protein